MHYTTRWLFLNVNRKQFIVCAKPQNVQRKFTTIGCPMETNISSGLLTLQKLHYSVLTFRVTCSMVHLHLPYVLAFTCPKLLSESRYITWQDTGEQPLALPQSAAVDCITQCPLKIGNREGEDRPFPLLSLSSLNISGKAIKSGFKYIIQNGAVLTENRKFRLALLDQTRSVQSG